MSRDSGSKVKKLINVAIILQSKAFEPLMLEMFRDDRPRPKLVSHKFWGVAVKWFKVKDQKQENILKLITVVWQQLGPSIYWRILTSI